MGDNVPWETCASLKASIVRGVRRIPCEVFSDSTVRYDSTTYSRRVRGYLGGFAELTTLEKLLVLLDIQLVCSWKVGPARQLESEFGVVEGTEDVWDNGLFVDAYGENLNLAVNTDDAIGSLVFSGDEDGFTANPVHVDAQSGFEIAEVNAKSVFDTMKLGNLHGNRQVIRSSWMDENGLDQKGVPGGRIGVDNLQLRGR
jgi:hypothetical protein